MRRWLPFTEGGISLPWCCGERGLVVEQVDVREAFGLEEAEDALGFGGEVGEDGRGRHWPSRRHPRRVQAGCGRQQRC